MGDRDSNGVPFTVAPVRADDPKRKDEKDKKEEGEEQQQQQNGLVDGKPAVNGKAGEEEELVSSETHLRRRIGSWKADALNLFESVNRAWVFPFHSAV
jgi:hypothetical protein